MAPTQRIVATDKKTDDLFGHAVFKRGNWLAISNRPNNAGDDIGVYLFEYDAGLSTWIERQKITIAGSGSGLNYHVALSISPNSNYLAVGLAHVSTVYLYVNTAGIWAAATGTASLISTGVNPSGFGFSVALTNDDLIVGEARTGGWPGRAWAYTRSGAETWDMPAEITTATPVNGDNYGRCVAIDESTIGTATLRIAIGGAGGSAAQDDKVWLWTRTAGPVWTHVDTLFYTGHAIPPAWRGFGFGVKMASDRLVVFDNPNLTMDIRGYFFKRNTGLETLI